MSGQRRIQVGDVRLAVVVEGDGRPLLLVHGFPLDHAMWRFQIEAFRRSRLVIAPDLRGFGASDATAGVAAMSLLADDLARLLDELRVDEPVALCGLSMGGYVAWQFWRRHPQRLRALVLCDTRAEADSPDAAETRRRTADQVAREGVASLADAMISKLLAPETIARRPDLTAAVRECMLRTSPEGAAAALRGMAEREDFTSALPSVDAPALALCGEHDALTPPDQMRALAAAMPRCRFALIPGAGHLAPWEQPDAVNQELQAFLSESGA